MGDDAVGELLVGVGRAPFEAGRFEALVARHRQVEALRLRIGAALDLADAAPRGARRKAVLLGARNLARVAADARVHAEPEPVLLTGVERQQLRAVLADPGLLRRGRGLRRLLHGDHALWFGSGRGRLDVRRRRLGRGLGDVDLPPARALCEVANRSEPPRPHVVIGTEQIVRADRDEADLLIDVWSRDARSVAQREGLA